MPLYDDGQRALRVWNQHPFHAGVYRGSAFAVSSRHVVTCRHVLDHTMRATDDELVGQATNFWVDGCGLPAALRVRRLWSLPLKGDRESDLALLEIGTPPSVPEHLQLPIEPPRAQLSTQTAVLLLGYGDEKQPPRAVPASLRSFDPALSTYIFTGHVPSGMSGGPALRGGQVVGVTTAREYKSGEIDVIPANFIHDLFAAAGLAETDIGNVGWSGDEMPSIPADIIGREVLTQELRERILNAQATECFALHGIPGVGKSTLAAHLARQPEILARFEGRIYWAGIGPKRLRQGFLLPWAQALNVYDDVVQTPDISRRKGILLAKMAGQRSLLIADDVWTKEDIQAHRLGGNCIQLFTTRLPEIAVEASGINRAYWVKELDVEEGLNLLSSYAPQAVAANRGTAKKLVGAVGALPLALALVGRILEKEEIVAQPKRMRQALSKALAVGVADSLDAVIAWSTAKLSPNELRTLLCLSVFRPKPNTFSESAVLAVSQGGPEELFNLVIKGLVEAAAAERYTLHQSISEYAARHLAKDSKHEAEAYQRMIEHYVSLVEAEVANSSQLAAEMVNVNVALNKARERQGYDKLFVRGANSYSGFLLVRGLYELGIDFLTSALEISQKLDDASLQAETAVNLALHLEKLGKYKEADQVLDNNERAIISGDPIRAARMYYVRAVIDYNFGNFSEANVAACDGIAILGFSPTSRFPDHLAHLSGRASNRRKACVLCQLLERRSITSLVSEDINSARQDCADGIRLARYFHDLLGLTVHILNASWIYERTRNVRRTGIVANMGLRLALLLEHKEHEIGFRHRLGRVALEADPEDKVKGGTAALAEFRQARDLAEQIGHWWYVSLCEFETGWAYLRLGDREAAGRSFEAAKKTALQIGSRDLAEFATKALEDLNGK